MHYILMVSRDGRVSFGRTGEGGISKWLEKTYFKKEDRNNTARKGEKA